MKLVVILTLGFLPMAWSQTSPQITFAEKEHNFGDVIQGEKVRYQYQFFNSGEKPLIIENVITTCGCTAPEWPKQPLAPGDTSNIKVVFDSKGKFGMQNKIIRVRSNADEPEVLLFLKGNVLPPENPYWRRDRK